MLSDEFGEECMQRLCHFLEHERALWPQDVYPKPECVFEAFRRAAFEDVKVVILGQDPYPRRGQATGLAFSLPPGSRLDTQSLRNIHKELGGGLSGGDLSCWADQGVLLLNTVLTIFGLGGSDSHRGRGWECFTARVIQVLLSDHPQDLVFMIWGNKAKAMAKRLGIVGSRHRVLEAPHPRVAGAFPKGFVGCGHFRDADTFLSARRINWHGA